MANNPPRYLDSPRESPAIAPTEAGRRRVLLLASTALVVLSACGGGGGGGGDTAGGGIGGSGSAGDVVAGGGGGGTGDIGGGPSTPLGAGPSTPLGAGGTGVAGGGGGGTGLPAAGGPSAPPGGGGTGDPGGGLAGGGIGGSGSVGVVVGRIAGFGSIFVGGVEFDTAGAEMLFDGVPGDERDLRAGMVVVVEGAVNADGATGTATRVRYERRLEGPIDSMNASRTSLQILGQTVLLDELTVYDGPGPDDFEVGNVLEVSGMADADGAVRATHMERTHPLLIPGVVELKRVGTVANLDPAAKTFMIGGQAVRYDRAMLENIPLGLLSDGMSVDVRGTEGIEGGYLVAGRVRAWSEPVPSGEVVKMEGYIARVNSAGKFEMNGLTVRTTEETVFEGGSPDFVAPNIWAAAEGPVSDGVLTATRVVLRPECPIRIEADLEAVDAAARTVTVLGNTVSADNWTVMFDTLDASVRPFDLEDLRVKDRLAISACRRGDQTLLAGKIERVGPSQDIVLAAPVDRVEGYNDLIILGVYVETISWMTDYRDAEGNEIDSGTFIAAVRDGAAVRVVCQRRNGSQPGDDDDDSGGPWWFAVMASLVE